MLKQVTSTVQLVWVHGVRVLKKQMLLSLSTKVGPATLGLYTADRSGKSGETNVSIAGKVAGTKV